MKKYTIGFLIGMLTISFCSCSLNIANKPGQKTLDSIARPTMNFVEQYVDNWYLFHNDRIYAYLFDGEDSFFSTDLNGNDKKMISQSEDLRYAELYLIYDNYAYYYTTYHQGIKKINIETGEIFNVIDGKYLYLIPDTLKDGKVVVEYENNYVNESHVYIAKLDLESGILSDEKILPFVGSHSYYYSGEINKVYFVGSDNDNNCLYEDGTPIYTYPSTMNDNDFAFVQDNYIFLVTADKIIKFDINKHSIIEERAIENNGYMLYASVRARSHQFKKGELTAELCTLAKPLVHSKDNGTYRLNSQTMEFEKINVGNIEYAFIQRMKNNLIFNGNNKTTIYDENTGKAISFSASNFGVDDSSIYVMTFDGDFYYQSSQKCEFKVRKIKF